MTRLLFWGDAQLESGLTLGHGEYGPGSRAEDQERMLDRIVAIAEEEHVDVVVNLGDSFERPYPAAWATVALHNQVRDLLDKSIEQVILLGNHDLKSAALPTILGVFHDDRVHVSQRPELIAVGDVVFATLPWAPTSRLVAAMQEVPRAELRAIAITALVQTATLLRERCAVEHPDKTPILLVHWSVSGAALPATGSTDDLVTDVVIPWRDLDDLGFTIVACAHIHRVQMIGAGKARTPMFYVGSPIVCNFGEAGYAHGCMLFDTVERELRFIEIPDRAFLTFDVDLTGPGTMALASVLAQAAESGVDGAIVRVRFNGTSTQVAGVDESVVQRKLLEMGARKVFVKTDVVHEIRARVEIDDSVTDVDALDLYVGSLPESDELDGLLADIRDQHVRYLEEAV